MKKYDEEFKREAVRKIFDGQSVASVSRELGVSENQLHNWKRVIKAGNTAAGKWGSSMKFNAKSSVQVSRTPELV